MPVYRNRRMREKLNKGEAIDVSMFPTYGGAFVLPEGFFKEDVDYCDAKNERWIWSIGRRKSDGVVLASYTGEFYQNDLYECLWLR
jgi:hypothetical protein